MATDSVTAPKREASGDAAPELAFVIVNWNGGAFLRRAVESILLFPPRPSFEIFVVDNCSTDGSLDWLRSEELRQRLGGARLRLIENEDNLGFGRASNQAFAATDARLLFLLNSDAELRPGACDILIAALDADDSVGACGPRLVNPDGSLQVSVWRNPPAAWATLVTGLDLHKLLPRRMRGETFLGEHWAHDRRREVRMLSGAAILARRRTIEEVGGFDERFHMYGEDNDWCLRISRAGWRLLFEPAATVMHHGGRSSAQRWTEAEKMRVQLRALFRFQQYALSRRQRVSNLLARSFVLALHIAWRRLRRRPAEDLSLPLKLHFEDLRKALRNRAS